jgi:hypothetical protein
MKDDPGVFLQFPEARRDPAFAVPVPGIDPGEKVHHASRLGGPFHEMGHDAAAGQGRGRRKARGAGPDDEAFRTDLRPYIRGGALFLQGREAHGEEVRRLPRGPPGVVPVNPRAAFPEIDMGAPRRVDPRISSRALRRASRRAGEEHPPATTESAPSSLRRVPILSAS